MNHRGIITALSAAALAGIGFGLSMPVLAFSLRDMGASGALIGMNAGMGAISTLVAAPLVPQALRHIPPRMVLGIALIFCAICFPLFYLVPNIPVWFFLRFVLGVGLTILFVTSEAWINQLASEAKRGRLIGYYASSLGLGFAIGGALPTVLGVSGWGPFLAGAAIFAIATLPLLIPGPDPEPPTGQHSVFGALPGLIALAPATMLAAVAFGAIEMSKFNFLALYGADVGLSERGGALMISAATLGSVATQPIIGWLADRMDRGRLLWLCALASAAGFALMPLVSGWPLVLYAVTFIVGGTALGIYTVALTRLGQRFPGSQIVSANAGFVLLYGAGSLFGPYLTGVSRDAFGPQGVPLALVGFALGYAILAIWRDRLTSRAR